MNFKEVKNVSRLLGDENGFHFFSRNFQWSVLRREETEFIEKKLLV
jgi:hypothetical protein